MDIKLQLPLRDIQVNQGFGLNYVDFYQQFGYKGHGGIDFRTKTGCPVLASHDGYITWAGADKGFGIYVSILSAKGGVGFRTRYGHLERANVTVGEFVKAGAIIGFADNTGKYTTGDHLHFDLAQTNHGEVINYNNGYHGCIDPAPYFPKNWDKSNAYHRYGRRQEWLAEFNMRFKNVWLHRQLLRRNQIYKIQDTEFINALVYGGYSFEEVCNPAMYEIWGWCTKADYKRGRVNFQ
ncbi:M23 family metallopeptidase [Candidatus Dojkabacteria bacterium]|jgi:hypothetical protein|nr:M23 family metallopeptidase [Candidatus Dojkabacteria bacterium]